MCKDVVACYTRRVVCLCVSLLDTTVSCVKMAEQLEMPFGLWTVVGPRNHVLGDGPNPNRGNGNFFEGRPTPL